MEPLDWQDSTISKPPVGVGLLLCYEDWRGDWCYAIGQMKENGWFNSWPHGIINYWQPKNKTAGPYWMPLPAMPAAAVTQGMLMEAA